MTRLIEIRTYRLKPGSLGVFREAMSERAVPFMRSKGIDVVAFGASDHEEETFFLIRAYDNRAALESEQTDFYGSPEWLDGPRQALVEHIEDYVNTLIVLSPEAVESVRTLNQPSDI
jgi:hypothetical protein